MQESELSVNGQDLQNLYNLYYSKKLTVNRRYQRKLVWSLDEKVQLVDSVVNELPIPLVLLAQRQRSGGATFEIIDGLQRLEAFFSFMENKFPYDGRYFDLDTFGDTKAKKDAKEIRQQEPVMSRDESRRIANYQIPVSVYREASESDIDDVFRRINSGGRRLSLHEIRQAGVLGPLADIVRKTSASIRGDGTFSDSILLNDMDQLSVSRRDLDYGIKLEGIFWVRHNIVSPDEIRSSGDEEMVLDLVLDAVLDPIQTTGWQNRDEAYGIDRKIRTTAKIAEVEAAVLRVGPNLLHQRLTSIVDLIDKVMDGRGSLVRHMIRLETYEKGAQRQFQAIFYALYQLTCVQGLSPKSYEAVRDALKDFWNRDLSIPTGGSAWGKDKKEGLYPKVVKRLRRAFYVPKPKQQTVHLNSRLYVESLLQGPVSEEPLIELKSGFCRLVKPPVEDVDLFEDVMHTAVAMASHSRNSEGLILIGISDKSSAAQRMCNIFNVTPLELSGHLITGTDEQIIHLGFNVDNWWRRWQEKIRSAPVDQQFANALAHSFKPVYCEDKLLWEMRPKSIGKPITYNNRPFVRIGSSTNEMTTDDFLAHLAASVWS